jgi:hypothetical protein
MELTEGIAQIRELAARARIDAEAEQMAATEAAVRAKCYGEKAFELDALADRIEGANCTISRPGSV